jgi:hypothetical protein
MMVALLLGNASATIAQVGYEPTRSPYRDLEHTMELNVFSGYYRAKPDVAQVAPRSGSELGVLYHWRASGPASLTFGVSRVASERQVIDPEQPTTCPGTEGNCRSLGMYRWPLYLFDGGLAISLTGARTYHRFSPELRGGFGLASDFHTQPDLGEFGFGTRFAFNWGAGLRWVPGGRYAIRADLLNHLYTVKYPESYYQSASDTTQILKPRQRRSVWLNNPGLTIGLSYQFSK